MGQKFAAYNTSGALTGFYDSVDSPMPSGITAIPITDAEWQDALSSPYAPTVENGALVIPTGPTLPQAQVAQVGILRAAYLSANASDISFTDSAGVADTYQADQDSIGYLNGFISAYRETGITPSGFYWRSATNKNNPFTYADLCGLGLAIANRGFENFTQLQGLITQVMTATTVSAAQGVIW